MFANGLPVFIVLVAAATAAFACPMPLHPDGATLRCAGSKTTLRLEGIKVLPPIDSCKPWEFCEADPGTAARDALAELTRGQKPLCRRVAGATVRCSVAGHDLSCAVVASGKATADGLTGCPATADRQRSRIADLSLSIWSIAAILASFNALALLATAFDGYRTRRGFGGIPERLMLLLALVGGAPGVLAGQMAFRSRDEREVESAPVYIVLGLQIGAIAGILLL